MGSILDDRRAVLFDGHDTDRPAPDPVKQQTFKDLKSIVDAIAERDAKRAEELVSDHLMRTLATINIWQ
jgi:DNA-binding GntR family transcriptional regulator